MNDLARMTTEDARVALASAVVAILPIGAIEQHGPHLELRTDTAIAQGFATKLAEQLGELAVLLPVLSYGLSEHHLSFPGTMTLRPATLRALLLDIFESVRLNGINKIIVVNGHGGNMDAIRLASREALRDFDMQVAQLMWAQLARTVVAGEGGASWRRNHACEVETSIAMALAPDLVHEERIEAPRLVGPRDAFTEPTSAWVDLPIWFDAWTENGALGDPRLATREKGMRIVEAAHANGLSFARQFIEGRPRSRAVNEKEHS